MSRPKLKVFWSWQSDFWPNACRDFIKAALAEAVKMVGEELGLEDADRPELDHDTKGEAGMVDIAATILAKIAESAVLVADLTPIGKADGRKALPNPNVLVELGWAFNRPGLKRVIGVLNTASGCRIEDLPFDIRQRRILTYELAEGAGERVRAGVHRQLVREFVGALRTNLSNHLEDIAVTAEVRGVPTRDEEPSIWASAKDALTHQDPFGFGGTHTVALPSGPRAYIRVIPAGWKNGPTMVADLARLHESMVVWPPGGGAGNFGVSEEGFLWYWITGSDDAGGSVTTNVTTYFDETGEFWVLHGTAIGSAGGRTMLRTHVLLRGWWDVISRAFAVFDRFGASAVRKVEVGLTGMSGVHWPSQWVSESPQARKSVFVYQRQSRDWSREAKIVFLTDAYNGVLNLFGQPKSGQDVVVKILGE